MAGSAHGIVPGLEPYDHPYRFRMAGENGRWRVQDHSLPAPLLTGDRTMPFKDKFQEKKASLYRYYQNLEGKLTERLQSSRERNVWIEVIYQSVQGFFEDKMSLHAGNFAYSAFLGIFPLLLFILSIVGFFFHYDPTIMRKVLDAIKNILPDMQVTVQAAGESMDRLRNTVGIISLIGLVWSMSRIAYTFQLGFEAAWGMKQRSYVAKKIYSVALMLLLIVVAVLGLAITFISTSLFSWVNQHTGPIISPIMVVASHIISPCATFLIFALLYRSIPKNKPRWKEILWGAIPMALLLDLFEYGLGIYFTKISKTQAIYGPLGIIIGIVLWLYFVGIFIFFGAEIVQTLQRRRGVMAVDGEGETADSYQI
jgi:membrane protein